MNFFKNVLTKHDCCNGGAHAGQSEPGSSPDLVVIGAGSAGFSAAIRGAELGARVALIGHGTIGGTCVNIGCVPSKTLIRAAETLHQARAAARFNGIKAGAELVDWGSLIAQKDALVNGLRRAKYEDVLPAYAGSSITDAVGRSSLAIPDGELLTRGRIEAATGSIAYVEGKARLTEQGVLVDGELYRPGRIIIATGASAAVPTIPGIGDIPWLTSTTALDLETLPTSLLVIGGGVIGCELGQLFARVGLQVTIVCRSRLLPQAEPEISDALAGYLRDEGVDVRCGVSYEAIRPIETGAVLTLRSADGRRKDIAAERVLVATGRRPNTADLGLEEIGIGLLPNGGIRVDDRLRTTRSGVYAAGDVTGRDMFVYMAAYGAKLAAENALNGDSRRYDATGMPDVTFTDPQVASVGLTETEARQRGIDVKISILPMDQVPRALAARDTRGLIKLVADRKTDRLLGAHMLAPEAGDSIQTAVLAVKHGLTVTDLVETIFPYLTNVEGLKLAALGFTKDVKKLSCCAG